MPQNLDGDALAALRDGFAGGVYTPEDGGYEDARTIFNSMIEKRPAAIAQVAGADDIRAALAFAVGNELEVAVRGGGHSVAGACLTEGGLEIDLRKLNRVTVDPEARTATAQGGASWGDFDRACQPHGLATTGGRVSTTGVAGLTLGGGSGWFERKFGLACDNLLAVELVTVSGETVRASEDENPELFWALHGGGGNFGIATELTFRLHELPAATLGLLLWPADAGHEVAYAYRDLIDGGAPLELGGGFAFLTGPPEEFVPEHLQNELCAGVIAIYAGTEAEARDVLAPVLALENEGGMIAEMPYVEIQSAIDDPPGYRNYWSAEYLHSMPDEALDLYVKQGEDMIYPAPAQHILFPQGGATAEGAADSPLAFRQAPWAVHPFGLWEDPADDDRVIAWCRGSIAEMKPYSIGATYLNFIADEGEERIISGYGRENYERLARLKAEYDPDDVFHLHHPIRPLAAA
jgi:FAD/FMN-containing dehydrogenase